MATLGNAWLETSTDDGTSAWPQWVVATTASTSTIVWRAWTTGATWGSASTGTTVYATYPVTADNLKRAAAEKKERAEADLRAEDLLRRHLNDEQRGTLDRGKSFEVIGSSGGRYRIRRGRHQNVVEVRAIEGKDVDVTELCATIPVIPDADVMLAQKLALETDEPAFLRVANRRQLRVA